MWRLAEVAAKGDLEPESVRLLVMLPDAARPRLPPVLILASNPANTVKLRLTEELKRLRARLAPRGCNGSLRYQPDARLEELPDLLQDDRLVEIVHFSGHGSEAGRLMFGASDELAQEAEPAPLAELFAAASDRLKCVFLNACHSGEQAEAISKHVEWVVGMSSAVKDSVAIQFAVSFYVELADTQDYEGAFAFALAAIKLTDQEQAKVPRLYRRGVAGPLATRKAPPQTKASVRVELEAGRALCERAKARCEELLSSHAGARGVVLQQARRKSVALDKGALVSSLAAVDPLKLMSVMFGALKGVERGSSEVEVIRELCESLLLMAILATELGGYPRREGVTLVPARNIQEAEFRVALAEGRAQEWERRNEQTLPRLGVNLASPELGACGDDHAAATAMNLAGRDPEAARRRHLAIRRIARLAEVEREVDWSTELADILAMLNGAMLMENDFYAWSDDASLSFASELRAQGLSELRVYGPNNDATAQSWQKQLWGAFARFRHEYEQRRPVNTTS